VVRAAETATAPIAPSEAGEEMVIEEVSEERRKRA
jgi:hypothetical protein